jgi:hypothetical protein
MVIELLKGIYEAVVGPLPDNLMHKDDNVFVQIPPKEEAEEDDH